MKDLTGFQIDVLFLIRHINGASDRAVQRWTDSPCRDYQLPLIRLIGYLSGFSQVGVLSLKGTPEDQAIVEIVKRSQLGLLLECDEELHRIKYRDSVPMSIREAVRIFIMDSTGAIGKIDASGQPSSSKSLTN